MEGYKKFNRRSFISQTLQGASWLASSSVMPLLASPLFFSKARADENGVQNGHLFLHIQIEGGADMLQSLEPLVKPSGVDDKELWRGYLDSDIFIDGEIALGPAAYALKPHLKDISIVKGIWMSTGNGTSHEDCRTYMASGINKGWKTPNVISAEVADQVGPGAAGVVLNTTREFWRLPSSVQGTETSVLSQLKDDPSDSRTLLANLGFGDLIDLLSSREAYVASQKNYQYFIQRRQAWLAAHPGAALDDYTLLVLGLASGIAGQGFFNLGGDYVGPGPGLDHHSNHTSLHLKHQTWHWEKVAYLLDLLKNTEYLNSGDSVFSKTTVYVSNEFSKSSYVNGSGKDHNPSTNAVLLAGKGIRPGVSLGRSEFLSAKENGGYSSNLFGAPIDFQTGKSLSREEIKAITDFDATRLIKPEHVIATLADILGIPIKAYRPLQYLNPRILPRIKG